jgi:hypothetical protein
MNTAFDHEKLNVYQESIRFVCGADELPQDIRIRIISMLVGLIRHTSAHRVYEQKADYGTFLTGSGD